MAMRIMEDFLVGAKSEVAGVENTKNKILFVLAIICSVLLSLMCVEIHGIRFGIVDTGVMVLFGIISLCRKKDLDFLLVFPCLFLLCIGISLGWNYFSGNTGLLSVLLFVRLGLVFSTVGFALWVTTQESKLRTVLTATTYGLLASVLVGLVLYFLDIKVNFDQQIMWFDDGTQHLRAGGIVGNTGPFGHQLFLLFTLSFLIWFSKPSSIVRRFIFSIVIGVVFYGVLISSSRGALLGIIIFSIIFLLGKYNKRFLIPLCWLMTGIGFAAALALMTLDTKILIYTSQRIGLDKYIATLSQLPLSGTLDESEKKQAKSAVKDPFNYNFVYSTENKSQMPIELDGVNKKNITNSNLIYTKANVALTDEVSIDALSSGRLENWKTYISTGNSHILFGVGYKNSMNYYGNLIDNSLLSILVESGIVTLIAFAAFWISMMWRAIYILVRQDSDKGWFLVAFVAANLTQSLFIDLYTQWVSFPVFLLVYYALALNREKIQLY